MIAFRPIRIGPVTVPGRICRSATAEGAAGDDGRPGERLFTIYRRLALGGTPWINTGFASVLPNGRCSRTQNGIHSDDLTPSWSALLEKLRRETANAKWFLQIAHGGRQVSPGVVMEPVAPSAVPLVDGGSRPREMTPREIEETIEAFGAAARRAREAGFDGVQLHAAHGYLIGQFLSPWTNRRTDEWGGIPERRRRFLMEILAVVRKAAGSGMAVTVKLNGEDFVQDGFSLAESCETARALAAAGIDAIEVSGFARDGDKRQSPLRPGDPDPREEGYYLAQALEIKRAAGTAPVGVCGGIRSYNVLTRILEADGLDFVAMSRPFIAEPDLVRRFAAGQQRATCNSCNECLQFNVPLHCPTVDDGRLTPPVIPGIITPS